MEMDKNQFFFSNIIIILFYSKESISGSRKCGNCQNVPRIFPGMLPYFPLTRMIFFRVYCFINYKIMKSIIKNYYIIYELMNYCEIKLMLKKKMIHTKLLKNKNIFFFAKCPCLSIRHLLFI